MSTNNDNIFTTKRLAVQTATIEDTHLYYSLWTNPEVMRSVGFPQGFPITQDEVKEKLRAQPTGVFEQHLVVRLKRTNKAIGECKIHLPDKDGVVETGIKLLPAYWGHKYGVEIKRGLLTFLFTQTDCVAVQAKPNIDNIASIKMQNAVRAVREGEQTFEFPESMRQYTQSKSMRYHIYRVYRKDWLAGF